MFIQTYKITHQHIQFRALLRQKNDKQNNPFYLNIHVERHYKKA